MSNTSTQQTLDGITGPTGECTCSHCHLDAVIDGIMTQQEYNALKEEQDDQQTVAVYQQIAPAQI